MPGECAACGRANRSGARFCAGCGVELELRCEACGASLAPDASFCDACGTPVASRQPRPPAAAESRKTLTVVFADMIGSTALQERLDPELARRIMTRFYERLRAVIESHGGSVEQFRGDGVVAAFGVQELREDDAIRGVRAAAAMVRSLAALNQELAPRWGVRLQMRTAVNTGELVVSENGILVGDPMNTAARLEQAGADGEVLVGEATWRLVHHLIDLEPIEPLELKGKSEPVPAWRLASVAGADRRRTPAAEAALVGRDDELSRLRDAFGEIAQTRACGLVTVMGSPGVGKTRLAREFGALDRGRATVLEARCEQTGEGLTFQPVAEVLRSARADRRGGPRGRRAREAGCIVRDRGSRTVTVSSSWSRPCSDSASRHPPRRRSGRCAGSSSRSRIPGRWC